MSVSYSVVRGSSCSRVCHTMDSFYEPSSTYYTHMYPADSQHSEGNNVSNDDWSSLCSPESTGRECSPTNLPYVSSTPNFHQYAPVYYPPPSDKDDQNFDVVYQTPTTNSTSHPPTVVRIVKRRNTANKKERRRTQSINTAFSSLRNKIPNVPADTKLSKIKTLRLATSYISYLTRVLEGDQDPSSGFRAELVPSSRKINAERRANYKNEIQALVNGIQTVDTRKCKGRTGWPQHVWASELKQE
ncbi:protein Fer3 isoform X2 [Hermetia illucens]|uniref:protein Fer3 isoform X2 n=1 Tax=Hermetia illucens TaxID=343691 RepID=UPI0018CC5978|nr:protein Fer3 isoform X2 [Hermetia illucens]